MPEKKKQEKDFKKTEEGETENSSAEQRQDNLKDTWSADQKERSYYYDDSYGYEVYNPDEEDIED